MSIANAVSIDYVYGKNLSNFAMCLQCRPTITCKYLISNKLKLFRLGSSCIDIIMAYYLLLLGVSLNLAPKYIPTLPEMPEPIDLLSLALTLAYSLLNMLVL